MSINGVLEKKKTFGSKINLNLLLVGCQTFNALKVKSIIDLVTLKIDFCLLQHCVLLKL